MMLASIKGKKGLPLQILIGFIAGIVVGFLFTDFAKAVKPLGDIFITLIQMIIIPLIFFTVSGGIANMGDLQKLKRIGSKVLIVYIGMTVFACIIGLGVGYLVRPGMGVTMATTEAYKQAVTSPTIGQFLMTMIPKNFLGAFAAGNTMQVLVLSLFVGIALVSLDGKGSGIKDLLDQGAKVCFVIIDMIMAYSPIGIFALMANSVAVYGWKVFGAMAKFILADYLSVIAIWFIVFSLPLIIYAKIDYLKFCKKMVPVIIVTLSTCSSAASLAVSMQVSRDDIKIPEWLVDFCLPLGGTINSAGAAMYKAVLIIFAADFYGLTLSVEQMILTVLISSMLSIAAPGIPGGGIVMGAIMMNLMGLPLEIIGLIAGIYRLIDMGHTTLNVVGDVVGAVLVGKNEGIWSNEEFVKESEA